MGRTTSRLQALVCAMLALLLGVGLLIPAVQPTLAFAADDPYHSQKQEEKEAKAAEKAEQEAKAGQEVVADAAKDVPDGTYYGSAYGYQSIVTVAVTVQDGMIVSITVVSHADDQSYVDLAMKEVDRIIASQSTDVDTVSGVTYSSTAILEATKDALSGDGTAAVTGSAWFSWLMIALALALLAGAGMCARAWMRASARAGRSRAMRIQRVLVQLMFFLLAPSAFASGFMGLKTLLMQVQVMQTQRGYDFELSTFTIFTIVFLVLTVVLGRFFCGYACTFGFAGDLVYRLRRLATDKLKVKIPEIPAKVEFVLRFAKYVVLLGVCGIILAGFMMAINSESPWTAFSSVLNLQFQRITLIGGVLLALIAVGCAWKERFFCEFLCPLGALFSLMPTLPTGRMRRNRETCIKGCAACRRHCPVHVEPSSRPIAGECLMCNRCADVCPAENIASGLEARAEELAAQADACEAAGEGVGEGASAASGSPKRTAAQLLLSRPVAVVWKSVLLLLVFWLMHITRFLPIIM